MASGAGLNRIGTSGGVVLLTLVPATTALATPWSQYGNFAQDSMATTGGGPAIVEGMGFTKVRFQIVPAPGSTSADGYTITVLQTNDSRAYGQWENSINPMKYYGQTAPSVPAASWSLVPSLSDQSGTGTDTNPMVVSNSNYAPILTVSNTAVAYRVVLTAVSTPTGSCQVIAQAVP